MLGTFVRDVRASVNDALGFTHVGYDVTRIGSHNPAKPIDPKFHITENHLHESAYPRNLIRMKKHSHENRRHESAYPRKSISPKFPGAPFVSVISSILRSVSRSNLRSNLKLIFMDFSSGAITFFRMPPAAFLRIGLPSAGAHSSRCPGRDLHISRCLCRSLHSFRFPRRSRRRLTPSVCAWCSSYTL